MVVIGGRKSVIGPIVATVVLTLVQQVHLLLPGLPTQVADALKSVQTELYAVLIIVLVLFAPQGLAALLRRRQQAPGASGGGEPHVD